MEKNLKHALGALLLAGLATLATAAPNTDNFASNPAVIEFAHDLEQRH